MGGCCFAVLLLGVSSVRLYCFCEDLLQLLLLTLGGFFTEFLPVPRSISAATLFVLFLCFLSVCFGTANPVVGLAFYLSATGVYFLLACFARHQLKKIISLILA